MTTRSTLWLAWAYGFFTLAGLAGNRIPAGRCRGGGGRHSAQPQEGTSAELTRERPASYSRPGFSVSTRRALW
jgi:hypothetical protein